MMQFIELLEYSSSSIKVQFDEWYKSVPVAGAWYIVSDYSVGDKNKNNDAFSFVVLQNHDTYENIAEFVKIVAPRDIKASKKASLGLIEYLGCPVTFSLNFLIQRESQFLKNLFTLEAMAAITDSLRSVVADWLAAEPLNIEYYAELDKKLRMLRAELGEKQPNSTLLRKVFLVSSFSAITHSLVNDLKAPLMIKWISDRDAMFDRFQGVAFDLTWLLFQIMRRRKDGSLDLNRPQIYFATPYMDGKEDYDEFVRLPDFLAGTLADMRLPHAMFSHTKFPPIFNNLLVKSNNNTILEIIAEPGGVTTARRIAFGDVPTGAKTARYHDQSPPVPIPFIGGPRN